jgi:hypothetical protein
MTIIRLVCIISSLLFFNGGVKAQDDANKLGLKALNAIGYGELLRVSVKRDCRLNAAFKEAPICGKINSISDEFIERQATPYFNQHVSPRSAIRLIVFWQSKDGTRIKKKMIAALGNNIEPSLTENEMKLLDEFNKSKAGQEAGASANDREASIAVFRILNSQ